ISASTTSTINGIIINSGTISGVSTLTTSGVITAGGGLTISGGHLRTTGPALTTTSLSSGCGTTANGLKISGTDSAGNITLGSNFANTCTLTFASAFIRAPTCIVVSSSDNANPPISSHTTTLSIPTALLAAGTNSKLEYICIDLP
ncbi:MAG: hypothetical protein KGL95_03740, partial [Patescibacteria group bacterium]|nr:hypothetical protein [Patescibacteria group bacterium]